MRRVRAGYAKTCVASLEILVYQKKMSRVKLQSLTSLTVHASRIRIVGGRSSESHLSIWLSHTIRASVFPTARRRPDFQSADSARSGESAPRPRPMRPAQAGPPPGPSRASGGPGGAWERGWVTVMLCRRSAAGRACEAIPRYPTAVRESRRAFSPASSATWRLTVCSSRSTLRSAFRICWTSGGGDAIGPIAPIRPSSR